MLYCSVNELHFTEELILLIYFRLVLNNENLDVKDVAPHGMH